MQPPFLHHSDDYTVPRLIQEQVLVSPFVVASSSHTEEKSGQGKKGVYSSPRMKTAIVLLCGLVLLTAAIVIQWEAQSWSIFLNLQGEQQIDWEKSQCYRATGWMLGALGILLTAIGAFRWTRQP